MQNISAAAPRRRFWSAALLAVALTAAASSATARQPAAPIFAPATAAACAATIALHELPAQGRDTWRLIQNGGPFPYEKDGQIFGNRERLLPQQPRGYWREYTVKTPGVRGRGARRIVCGGAQPTRPDACYYTSDHYASFKRIAHEERDKTVRVP